MTAATRDGKTALVTFDIAWSNAWRHGSFHDAAWVFFKVRADDKTGWQQVRLAADRMVNPTGYGKAQGGTPLEFVVPGGQDGFVGMFVRRAGEGKGPVAAKCVTAVWELAANKGISKNLKGASIRMFGIEMVYVAEGPFYLGSGGGAPLKPWQGPADLGAKVYLDGDATALYIGAVVTDDRHLNNNRGDEIRSGDAMHFRLVNPKGVHFNAALALTAGGVALHPFEGRDDALLKIADCAVVRDEPAGVTRYGLRLPLAVLGLRPGKAFGLTILFFDDDEGSGHRCWLELAPGLAGLHDVTLYPRFILAK